MSNSRLRLFVALELPEQVRQELARWRREAIGGHEGIRFLDAESLHVTLCFLGWQSEASVEAISLACDSGVHSVDAGRLSLGEPLWLPPRRPRVLAVALEDPDGSLSAVQAQVSAVLQAGGWYTPESRPFLAHVTVARVRAGARVRPSRLPPPAQLQFEGSTVTLYRSRLGGQGARYEPLRRVRLS